MLPAPSRTAARGVRGEGRDVGLEAEMVEGDGGRDMFH